MFFRNTHHRNEKVIWLADLVFTGDVEACFQRFQWRPGQWSRQPFCISGSLYHEISTWFYGSLFCNGNIISSHWINMMHLPIFFRVTSLALGQSYDCPSASEGTLRNRGKICQWISTLRLWDNCKIAPVLVKIPWVTWVKSVNMNTGIGAITSTPDIFP